MSPSSNPKGSHLLNQTDLNDLVRDLKLSKDKSELLSSRLKEWNLLQPGPKVTYFHGRHTSLAVLFKEDKNICYCFYIDGLFRELGSVHVSEEWRLFIDSGKDSLKAVVLHNGIKKTVCAIGVRRQNARVLRVHGITFKCNKYVSETD